VKDAIHFYKGNELILPGVTALSAPGHTVSHTIFMIESGGKKLCYVGDLADHPVLLLERPRTSSPTIRTRCRRPRAGCAC
jgi:glyoxylase-like metal-dependent hydrolase (beta-lactamase superfamily II)